MSEVRVSCGSLLEKDIGAVDHFCDEFSVLSRLTDLFSSYSSKSTVAL